MTKVGISAQLAERSRLGLYGISPWSLSTSWWMAAGFVVACGLMALMLALFGVGERGTSIALRATARWSFLLFWPAYSVGALATLWPGRFSGLAKRGREFGLAFASAQVVHVGLVLWLYRIAARPQGAMLFFWAGILCIYLLALFSLPRLYEALQPRSWRVLSAVTMDYVALVFATDFIILPLQEGAVEYPLSYIPFALMLMCGLGLRIAAAATRLIGQKIDV